MAAKAAGGDVHFIGPRDLVWAWLHNDYVIPAREAGKYKALLERINGKPAEEKDVD